MSIGIIIQARTQSTRLPNKTIIPFYQEENLLTLLIKKVQAFSLPMAVATSNNPEDIAIVTLCQQHHMPVYQGSETDVLDRFIHTAQHMPITGIIRICADNPFLDMDGLKQLIEVANTSTADYISFTLLNGTPSIKSHLGLYAEYVTLQALQRITKLNHEKHYREHVTNFIYENPLLFDIKWLSLPLFIANRFDLRFTMDTPSDFLLYQQLYPTYLKMNHLEKFIAWIDTNHAIKEMMYQHIQEQKK